MCERTVVDSKNGITRGDFFKTCTSYSFLLHYQVYLRLQFNTGLFCDKIYSRSQVEWRWNFFACGDLFGLINCHLQNLLIILIIYCHCITHCVCFRNSSSRMSCKRPHPHEFNIENSVEVALDGVFSYSFAHSDWRWCCCCLKHSLKDSGGVTINLSAEPCSMVFLNLLLQYMRRSFVTVMWH